MHNGDRRRLLPGRDRLGRGRVRESGTPLNPHAKRLDNGSMTAGLSAAQSADRAGFARAVDLLQAGDIQAGAALLGQIAKRSTDAELCSQCRHALAQVLEQLGQPDQAYGVWFDLAHKPSARRNRFDLSARMEVMRLFNARGLRLRPPDFPPRVQVEITNRCNLRCVMCTRNQMRRPVGDLPLELLQKVADECSREPGAVILLFFLGEPLLHPQLEDMARCLAAVKDRQPIPLSFGIQTNGMLLSRERARRLIEAGLRQFHFSVDGLEGDLERIRPGAEYAVVERNILDLLALREELGCGDIQVDICKLCDDPQAEEVARFVRRWEGRVDRIQLLPITKVAGNAYLDAAGELREIQAAGGETRVYCGQGQRLLILANGDYAFCHGDVNGEFGLGNVAQRSIRDVWNGAELAAVRRKIVAAEYDGLPSCDVCPLGRC